jgi:hypothetical protein
VGTTNLRSQGGLRRCVAFQTHPAHATKEESVEQPCGVGDLDTPLYLAIAGREAVGEPIGGWEPAAPQGQ